MRATSRRALVRASTIHRTRARARRPWHAQVLAATCRRREAERDCTSRSVMRLLRSTHKLISKQSYSQVLSVYSVRFLSSIPWSWMARRGNDWPFEGGHQNKGATMERGSRCRCLKGLVGSAEHWLSFWESPGSSTKVLTKDSLCFNRVDYGFAFCFLWH